MCLHPVLIKNPNYLARSTAFQTKLESHFSNHMHPSDMLKDTTNPYMYVPCGTCPVCLMVKQNYLIQRAQIESFDHYCFFGTLTYDNEHLPYKVYNGYTHHYADMKDFVHMYKRLEISGLFGFRDVKYIVCTEYGGKKHRPHFHFVLFVEKKKTDTNATPLNLEWQYRSIIRQEWRRCVKRGRKPVYEPLFTYHVYRGMKNFDFHYVNPKKPGATAGNTDVVFYVTKYVLKYDSWFRKKQQALRLNLPDDEYKDAMHYLKPRVQVSKFFGKSKFGEHYFRKCFEISRNTDSEYLRWYSPIDGRSFPMSPRLRYWYMTMDEALYFLNKRSDRINDYDSATDQIEYENQIDDAHNNDVLTKYNKILSDLEARGHNAFAGDHLELSADYVNDIRKDVADQYELEFGYRPFKPSTDFENWK